MTSKDSVQLHWNIRGKADVTFHQEKIRYFDGDSVQQLRFVLVARKMGSSTAGRQVAIPVLPPLYRDRLILPVVRRQGDTLVAVGIKDSLYRNFMIVSMASVNQRKILALHGMYETMLYDSSKVSKSLQGVDFAGSWQLMALLTPEEKRNPDLIPKQFTITVNIRPKNP
jgi:hypothetical protein